MPAGASTDESPSLRHSSTRRAACVAGPQAAGEADLAERGQPLAHRRRRARPRRSRARSRGRRRARRSRTPPATLTKTSAAAERQPGVPRRARRRSSRGASGRRRCATRRGIARSVGATSAWISSSSGRVPSSAQVTAAPTSPGSLRPKSADGSGTPTRPGAGHLEHAELVRRAEAVLDRAQDAVGVVAVALELEHAVDEVLEHARAGDRAVLRHVADEERRDAGLLGDAQEPRRRLAHLRDRAGRRAELGRVERLHRVDHADGRAARARASRRPRRARSRRGSRPRSQPPSRAARSFTCATDSSPVTSSARRVVRHRAERRQQQRRLADARARRRRARARRARARRRARGRARRRPSGCASASSASTSTRRSSGRAWAGSAPRAGAASSTIVPNAPQPGQRPSHRPETVPHSVHAC